MHAAVERTGYASSLVFTPSPVCYQLCSDVVNQSRQLIWLETNLLSAICVSTSKTAGVLSWSLTVCFLVMIQAKDGPSDCETMALVFILIVKEYNYFT